MTAVAAVAATVAAVLVVGPGYDTAQVRMHPGALWVTSVHTGQIVLVDGTTAEVRARVPVAEPGTALSVAQQGGAAYALNHRTGQLRRVDSATEQVSSPVSVLPVSDGLAVHPAPDLLHVVDVHSGMVAAADLGTLTQRGEPRRLAGAIRPDGVLVDGRGRLWAVEDETGDLVWLTGGEPRRSPGAVGNGHLAITGDQPAVVDPARGTAELLDDDTGVVVRTSRAALRAGDAVAVTGSTRRSGVLIANSTRGELIMCGFGADTCGEPVEVSAEGADLGNAVEVGDHAVVPDYSTGSAAVVDLATARVVARHELFSRPTRFELLARDGIVFFNDPSGNTAGVLDLAGDVRTVVKYAGGPVEAETAPAPDQRAQPNQVTKAGHRAEKPGLGLPRGTVRPTPAPEPAAAEASIAVRPGNHGVVGEEFELAIVLRSPIGKADTRWRLGDGTETSGPRIRHRWQRPGVHLVQAITTFATGARVLAQTAVTVDLPEAPPRITALHVRRPQPVIGEPVRFSAGTIAQPDSWAWTVTRPGSTAPEAVAETPEFDHTFATAGTYTVSLTIGKGTLTTRSSRQFTVVTGTVRAWGANNHGQTDVPATAASGVIAIDAGAGHSLALKANGSVIAWGANDSWQSTVPAEASSGVIGIAAGALHNLALKADGSVIAWGANDHGQTDVPPAAASGVIAVSAGTGYSVALKANGSVIAWGYGYEGQVTVPPEASTGVTAISAGHAHTLAVKEDGSVIAWGRNDEGEVLTPPEARGGVQAVAGCFLSSLALKTDGSVIGWGQNRWGQIAIPPSAKSGVAAIDCNARHGLALKTDGTVIGWGHDGDGEASVPAEYRGGVHAVVAADGYSLVLM
jgi:PKD repeat protein